MDSWQKLKKEEDINLQCAVNDINNKYIQCCASDVP